MIRTNLDDAAKHQGSKPKAIAISAHISATYSAMLQHVINSHNVLSCPQICLEMAALQILICGSLPNRHDMLESGNAHKARTNRT